MTSSSRQLIYDIVDSSAYVDTNCYQHQLTEVLTDGFDVKRLELADLHYGCIPEGGIVLSRLKLRTLAKNLGWIAPILKHGNVFVYEQDTWENFLVGSPYFGSYKRICEAVGVTSFINMSYWWADLVRSTGIPAGGAKPWTLPRYCAEPIPWSKRTHDVIFCGTLYPERRIFIDQLRAQGVNIEVVPAGKDYPTYLSLLSDSRIAIRSERKDWRIDSGQAQTLELPNAQWQRDIECAARGCVSMREHDDEAAAWGIERIPSIIPFFNVENAAANVRAILGSDPATMDGVVEVAIKVVKKDRGYHTVVDAIRSML